MFVLTLKLRYLAFCDRDNGPGREEVPLVPGRSVHLVLTTCSRSAMTSDNESSPAIASDQE
ncbi:hypothetical protein BaRGS_00021023, partial [Batillaria attramentaria]